MLSREEEKTRLGLKSSQVSRLLLQPELFLGLPTFLRPLVVLHLPLTLIRRHALPFLITFRQGSLEVIGTLPLPSD